MKLWSRYLWRFYVCYHSSSGCGSVTVLSVITCLMTTLSPSPPAASWRSSASHWSTLRLAAACHWSDHRRRRRGRARDREQDSCREVVRLTGDDTDTLRELSRVHYIKCQVWTVSRDMISIQHRKYLIQWVKLIQKDYFHVFPELQII